MTKCQARKGLRGPIGDLYCHREASHEGMHRDNVENLWWWPGVPPLETVSLHPDGSEA